MKHHRESTEARLPEAFWCAAGEFAATLENDESTGDMRTGREAPLSEPWPVNLGSGQLMMVDTPNSYSPVLPALWRGAHGTTGVGHLVHLPGA